MRMYTKDPKWVSIASHRFVFLLFAITTQMGTIWEFNLPNGNFLEGRHDGFSSFGPWHSRAGNIYLVDVDFRMLI